MSSLSRDRTNVRLRLCQAPCCVQEPGRDDFGERRRSSGGDLTFCTSALVRLASASASVGKSYRMVACRWSSAPQRDATAVSGSYFTPALLPTVARCRPSSTSTADRQDPASILRQREDRRGQGCAPASDIGPGSAGWVCILKDKRGSPKAGSVGGAFPLFAGHGSAWK